MKMSNKTYDALKWVAQFLLPGAGSRYYHGCRYFPWSSFGNQYGEL